MNDETMNDDDEETMKNNIWRTIAAVTNKCDGSINADVWTSNNRWRSSWSRPCCCVNVWRLASDDEKQNKIFIPSISRLRRRFSWMIHGRTNGTNWAAAQCGNFDWRISIYGDKFDLISINYCGQRTERRDTWHTWQLIQAKSILECSLQAERTRFSRRFLQMKRRAQLVRSFQAGTERILRDEKIPNKALVKLPCV